MNKRNSLYAGGARFYAFVLATLFFWNVPAWAGLDIEHWQTENGARVYFVRAAELPMVNVQVVFDAGSARDGDRHGLGMLTNGLLAEGAGGLDANEISKRFEAVGAEFSNSSHRDMSVLSLRSLTDPKLLEPALGTFARVLGQPDFPEKAIARERNNMLVALQGEEQSPRDIAERAFYAAVYGSHPYAGMPTGDRESIARIKSQDIVAHYGQYYVARNAVVAIVGDLDRAGAQRLAKRITSDLRPGKAAPELPAVEPLEQARLVAIEHPSTQTHVLMGQPGIRRDDPGYFPLYVGNHVLGGSGLVSRISEEVREKRGLSYSAYSYFVPMTRKGPYVLGLQSGNDTAAQALTVLGETLQTFVAEGPTAEELAASKKNITGGFPLRIDSNSDIVQNLAVIGFYQLPLDYLDTFSAKVEAVSIADIRDAFQQRVDPQRMVTVTVGATVEPEVTKQ